MENIENESVGIEGGSMDDLTVNAEIASAPDDMGEQREDSDSGAIQSGTEAKESIVKLDKIPTGVWEDYRVKLDEIQRYLATHEDISVSQLRVAKASIPIAVVPSSYDTGQGGISTKIGDEFTILLTNGETITAV